MSLCVPNCSEVLTECTVEMIQISCVTVEIDHQSLCIIESLTYVTTGAAPFN